MKQIVALCLVVYLSEVVVETQAKNFTRCGLIKELLKNGFSSFSVGNWLCLIESESGKDTSKQIYKADGNTGLGLFQIKSRVWCKFRSPGGKCNMKCEDLLNDDISDDSICAREVHNERGFSGWEGWKRSCCGRSYPSNVARVCLPGLQFHEQISCL
ncbi:lysozyme [Anoplophora glabripennis]|nr:lysozyme [Anoplophora glabripennis]